MASTQRSLLARQVICSAGRLPRLLAIATAVAALPSAAWAQNAPAAPAASAPAPRSADKGDKAKDDKPKVVVSEHMTVDLHVKDEDLANVLELLSIQTQKNIIASKSVSGKVTATLYGVTFYQALDSILHVNGFGYMENGNFIYVYTKDELKQIESALKKRITKALKLNYLNADDAKEFVEPLLSKDGGRLKINKPTKDFSISDKTPVGKNDYALGDTLVVYDFEENVKAIEELVKQIDTCPAQVLVEATILQTSLNEANAFGVDFSIIGGLDFLDFINTGGALSAANSLIKGGTGASGGGVSPSNRFTNAVTSTPGNTASGPGTFKVGVVAGDVGIFLRMLDQVTDTVILSNPKLLALNRQAARVLVGKRIGYLNTTTTDTSTTQSVEFLATGTQLYIRPFVSSEGMIRMEIRPSVSSAELRNVTDSKGATVTIPDENTQELTTNVNIRDGQTIVLGGLFTENSTFTRRQVPWAGDLPIIGAAFRGNDDSTVRSEIIFLITPSIVTDVMLASSAERAGGEIERVRTGTRQGLLPWSREKMTDSLNVEAEKLAREGDYEKALFNIQRSLSLNPNQPEAYRLRERITGQREHWNNPSNLDDVIGGEVQKRLQSIQPAPSTPEHKTPKGAVAPVFKPVPTSNQSVQAPQNPDWTVTGFNPIAVPGGGNTAALPATLTQGEGAAQYVTINGNAYRIDEKGNAWSVSSSEARSAMATAHAQNSSNNNSSNTNSSSEQSTASASNSSNAPSTSAQPAPAAPAQASVPTDSTTPVASSDSNGMLSPMPNAGDGFTTEQPAPAATANNSESPANTPAVAGASTDSVAPTNDASVNAEPANAAAPNSNTNSNPGATSNNNPADAATQAKADANHSEASKSDSSKTDASKPEAYIPPVLSETEKSQVSSTRDQLPGLRGQIELFAMMNSGTKPALGKGLNAGWEDLFSTQLLKALPANTYVSGVNATKVVIGEKPDAKFHTDYGWIYNPKTGQLWAAGFDAKDRPIDKATLAAAPAQPNPLNANANNAPAQAAAQPAQPEHAPASAPTASAEPTGDK